jgi:hypothetical protein
VVLLDKVNREELKNKLMNLKKLSQFEQKLRQNKKYDIILVDESFEIDPKKIKPVIIKVDSKSPEWKQWKAIEEHVASFEFRRSSGRNCFFLIKNEYDNKNLGILDVAADLLSLGPRDQYIGWDRELQKKYNKNIANISVCVPTRHFGYNLCGGKLLALIAISNEVAQVWKDRYGDNLVGLTVTSLYGKSVQYNRLKHFKYLGLSSGQGTCHVPMEVYRECRRLVEEEEGEIKSGCFTTGKNSSIRIIRKACKYLDLDPSIVMTHGRRRGVYWCDRGYKTKEFLNGLTYNYEQKDLSLESLVEYWRETWAYRRIHNLTVRSQLNTKEVI